MSRGYALKQIAVLIAAAGVMAAITAPGTTPAVATPTTTSGS